MICLFLQLIFWLAIGSDPPSNGKGGDCGRESGSALTCAAGSLCLRKSDKSTTCGQEQSLISCQCYVEKGGDCGGETGDALNCTAGSLCLQPSANAKCGRAQGLSGCKCYVENNSTCGGEEKPSCVYGNTCRKISDSALCGYEDDLDACECVVEKGDDCGGGSNAPLKCAAGSLCLRTLDNSTVCGNAEDLSDCKCFVKNNNTCGGGKAMALSCANGNTCLKAADSTPCGMGSSLTTCKCFVENGSDCFGSPMLVCVSGTTCLNSDAACRDGDSGCTCGVIEKGGACGAESDVALPCPAGSLCLRTSDSSKNCGNATRAKDCKCYVVNNSICGGGKGTVAQSCTNGNTCLKTSDNTRCGEGADLATCKCLVEKGSECGGGSTNAALTCAPGSLCLRTSDNSTVCGNAEDLSNCKCFVKNNSTCGGGGTDALPCAKGNTCLKTGDSTRCGNGDALTTCKCVVDKGGACGRESNAPLTCAMGSSCLQISDETECEQNQSLTRCKCYVENESICGGANYSATLSCRKGNTCLKETDGTNCGSGNSETTCICVVEKGGDCGGKYGVALTCAAGSSCLQTSDQSAECGRNQSPTNCKCFVESPGIECVTIHRHSSPTSWVRNNAPCSDIIPVRCCDQNGKCSSFKPVCHWENFADADYFCRDQGMRLCTTEEYKMPPEDGGCGGTGCGFDNEGVWISDIEICDILVDLPENRRSYSSLYRNEDIYRISRLTSSSAWLARKEDTSPYMIIDLEKDELVSGTAVAGRVGLYYYQYVTIYTVTVSKDRRTWELVGEFQGKSEQTTNMFTTPKYARYVKLTVKAFNNHPSMRAGIVVKRPCAVDCEMNNWAEWEPCSQLCEGGEQSRYRTIVQEANYGGKQCAGTAGYRTCNTHKCPVWETVFECGQSMDFYLIIPPDAYSHMRICVSGSDTDCVVSKTKDPLNDLRTTGRAQKRIDFCDYNCIAQVWNGPPTYLEKLTYTCSPIDSYRIYHACGNGVGLHVPTSSSDKCTWNDKQQNPLVVQLQVVICDENYRVSNNTCILCPAGTIRNAGDHASGNDTFCEVPCLWSVWSSWSDACNGDCGLPTARKFRYRYVEQQRLHSGSKCEGESVQSEDCNFPVCNSTMYCEGSLLSGNLTKELFKERRLECREKCKIKCTQDDLCGDAPVQRSKVWKDPNWTRRWFGTILSKFMAEIAMGDSFEYPSVSPDRAYKPCMWLLPTCANASECEVGSPFKREPVRHILDNFYQWYFSEGNVNTRASSVGERQRFNVGGRAMKSEDAKSPNRDRCVSRCRSWCYESCSCNWGWEFPWSNEEDMGWAHGKPMRYRWIRNVQRKQSYGTWTCVSSDGEPLRTPWDKPFWHLDVYSDAVKQRVNVAPLQFNLVCEHIKHYYALQVCGTEKCKLDCTKAAQPVVDFLYTRNMLQPKYMKKGGKKHRALLVDRLHTDIHKNCRRTCAEAHVPAFLHLYPIH